MSSWLRIKERLYYNPAAATASLYASRRTCKAMEAVLKGPLQREQARERRLPDAPSPWPPQVLKESA